MYSYISSLNKRIAIYSYENISYYCYGPDANNNCGTRYNTVYYNRKNYPINQAYLDDYMTSYKSTNNSNNDWPTYWIRIDEF